MNGCGITFIRLDFHLHWLGWSLECGTILSERELIDGRTGSHIMEMWILRFFEWEAERKKTRGEMRHAGWWSHWERLKGKIEEGNSEKLCSELVNQNSLGNYFMRNNAQWPKRCQTRMCQPKRTKGRRKGRREDAWPLTRAYLEE